MIYVRYTDANGKMQSCVYEHAKEYIKDTFSPACEEHELIEFKIKGKSYVERRKCLRSIAVNWSWACAESYGLSYGELGAVQSWFEKNGRRYGLLREFRENAIC